MIDISLKFNTDSFEFDLVLEKDMDELNEAYLDLQGDDGLTTAIIISLFTDRRAKNDDILPEYRPGAFADMRGFWGDYFLDDGEITGSRLWLLHREKDMNVVISRATEYAKEAIEWLEQSGEVKSISARARRVSKGYLGIEVSAALSIGADEKTREWNFTYDYKNAKPIKLKLESAIEA